MTYSKYIGYCVDCGELVKEYCHNYLCLSCCSKRVEFEREIYYGKEEP